MEKTRVPEGEKYWFIIIENNGHIGVCLSMELYQNDDDARWESGNYFHTKEEAESMARKLRAVLNGAEVIETLSEEEMKAKIKEVSNKTINNAATSFLGYIDEMSSTFCEWAIENMINYLKSKIIK